MLQSTVMLYYVHLPQHENIYHSRFVAPQQILIYNELHENKAPPT